jgi:hypothetical protein
MMYPLLCEVMTGSANYKPRLEGEGEGAQYKIKFFFTGKFRLLGREFDFHNSG